MPLKSFPLLLILVFSSVILSCMEENCRDALPYFEVQSLGSVAFRKGTETPLTAANPTAWNQLEYQIDFNIRGLASLQNGSSGNLFALDCAGDGYLGAKVGIQSLRVRPLTAYSEFDQPDAFSSSLFKIEVINEQVTIPEFNLIFREKYEFTRFKLLLSRAPLINGELQKFEVELTFMDGRQVKVETPELRILK